jgi:hypothetical protein
MAKVKDAPPEVIKETYRLHDEVDSNPASRSMFSSNTPGLDERQRTVVEELETEGFAVVRLGDLFSSATWADLVADAQPWTREMERKTADGVERKPKPGKPAKPGKEKFFMGRRFKKTPLTLANPWLQLGASPRMLDIVNTYLGMWSKLTYADQWYTPPRGSEADRLGSMRWHRDYNDQHLVKVFVYLVDVDEGTGPFEYVPGSARGGPYANEWPWEPAGESYPPQDEFESRIPSDAVRTFTAPAGSMIFCNTSGFHRGGFATERPRNIFVYNYVSPAALEALVDRNFDVAEAAAGLPDAQRFALT